MNYPYHQSSNIEKSYTFNGLNLAKFKIIKGSVWLDILCGIQCGYTGEEISFNQTCNMFHLSTGSGIFEEGDLLLEHVKFNEDKAFFRWKTIDEKIYIESEFSFCKKTGVISHTNKIKNIDDAPTSIFRALPRFSFSCNRYEVYAQEGRWCNENQGAWVPLHAGSILLSNNRGRSSEGSTPYICFRDPDKTRGIAFHVVPLGNWVIKIHSRTEYNKTPFAVIELGLSDQDLNYQLESGESLELPEILIQSLPEAKPHLAAPFIHEYLNNRLPEKIKPFMPVIYNTWFDRFDELEVEHLREELAVAKKVGCEVFVVDAGWYGANAGDWNIQVGDWREKQDAAFCGNMRVFSDEVREAGLEFGLWMEPERFCPNIPVRINHPEWFIPSRGNLCRIDLSQKEARDYQYNEICRLIETYQAKYIKFDNNMELGLDRTGQELYEYFEIWHDILDRLRHNFPNTFIENCSSGGLRMDINSLFKHDGTFTSDSVNPVDVLRICQGAFLRLPPGRIIHWAVLRKIEICKPRNWNIADIITPKAATWDRHESFDLDFLISSVLHGMFGISGDIAGLNEEEIERFKWYVDFYKEWRLFITRSVAHLLTGVRPLTDRQGWIAFQLQNSQGDKSLVFVYHLANDGQDKKIIRLCNLGKNASYIVKYISPEKSLKNKLTGSFLMDRGLEVIVPTDIHGIYKSAIYIIEKVKPDQEK